MKPKNVVRSNWNGFERLDFELDDRRATVVFPHTRVKYQKWVLKTEYLDAYPEVEIELLKKGYARAFISNRSRWCVAGDLEAKAEFCAFLQAEYGWNQQCVPLGMSCGGMIAIYFAARYPERVAGLYLDAPVTNLLSCPCNVGNGKSRIYEEFCEATGMTVIDMINYRNHPIDRIDDLLRHRISILLVCGDRDEDVPYEENGKVFARRYLDGGGILKEIVVSGRGHNPHHPGDLDPVFEFMNQYY